MRRILATVLTLLALTALPAAAAEFFDRLGDVPVMPALAPVEQAGIEFDTPAGRIAEAYAIGPVSRRAVLDFYGETLPQLGWQAGGGNAFRREDETLRIDFFGLDGDLTVRFTVAPATPAN